MTAFSQEKGFFEIFIRVLYNINNFILFGVKTVKIQIKDFILSILAGISISLGCLIYLLSSNVVIGAMFFTVGLFLVLTRGYNLFTGKVAYATNNDFKYSIGLILMWIGNFIGTIILSLFTRFSSLYPKIVEKAETIVLTKTSQTYLSAFLLAFLCGIIIFLAVENFKNNKHEIGKYAGLFVLIPLFIICGFEHCVADMYYFLLTNDLVKNKVIYLIIITIGNSIGSIVSNEIMKYKNKGE